MLFCNWYRWSEGFVWVNVARNNENVGKSTSISRIWHWYDIICWHFVKWLWWTASASTSQSVEFEFQAHKPVNQILNLLLSVFTIVWVACPFTHDHDVRRTQDSLFHSLQALDFWSFDVNQSKVNDSTFRENIINTIYLNFLSFDCRSSYGLVSKNFRSSSINIVDGDVSLRIFITCTDIVNSRDAIQPIKINIFQYHVIGYTKRLHNVKFSFVSDYFPHN